LAVPGIPRERDLCIMRKSHPIARRKTIAFDDFIGQEHMKVSMSPTDLRFVDDVLGELGHQRKIVLNVPQWLVVPHVLKQTDLLAVMPGHLAATLADNDLQMFDVPFKSEPFSWMMYWHRRYDQSNANRWLRDHVQRVCAALN
jgi:DNA-binding transcriptional LysR family regulator